MFETQQQFVKNAHALRISELSESTDLALCRLLEEHMETDVRETVAAARNWKLSLPVRQDNARLLLHGLLSCGGMPCRGFLVWDPRRGKLLGANSCNTIGLRVCARLEFTIKEARSILTRIEEKSATPLYRPMQD